MGGGGFSNDKGNPTLTNCSFVMNRSYRGGGMSNDSGSPTLINCVFDNNKAYSGGGGFHNSNRQDSNTTLVGCVFKENRAEYYGGGVSNLDYGDMRLVDCTFIKNWSSHSGGGLFNYFESNAILTNCVFSMNWSGEGGGFYNEGLTSIMENCTFSNNSAHYGGGICFEIGIRAELTNCVFSKNSASVWGGAIDNGTDDLILTNCTFNDNESDYRGGGIYNTGDTAELISCTFSRNSSLDGGGMYNGWSELMLLNCIFSQNSASESGGGIYNSGAKETILTNCIFSGNSAGWNGGCMLNNHCDPMLTNCTFSINSAVNGGVIFNSGSNATLSNCILRGNTATHGNEVYLHFYIDSWGNEHPSTINVDYSNIEDGATGVYVDTDCTLNWGEGNIDVDPLFVEPGYWDTNGLWIDGDYHLPAGSPCINAGDPNYIAEPNETDLDGRPRVIGCRIDMGAFEYMKLLPAEVSFVPHNINLANKGRWITCYIRLPQSYNIADIDFCVLLPEYEIEPEQFLFNEEKQVVVARFNYEQLQGILGIGAVELTINAQLTDGTVFEGTDVIKVINEGGGKLAKFGMASNPNPSDGAKGVSLTSDLSWTAGSNDTSYDVYFGTSSSPPFVCNQISTTFDPGTMDYETQYYWRIDEVSKWGVITGQLWSFTTIKR
jgi:predicted outer membrane repeat protein